MGRIREFFSRIFGRSSELPPVEEPKTTIEAPVRQLRPVFVPDVRFYRNVRDERGELGRIVKRLANGSFLIEATDGRLIRKKSRYVLEIA